MASTQDISLVYSPAVSLRSRVLHYLGCLFIGTPASMHMPHDFYYIEADRDFPAPGELDWKSQRQRIFVDGFRRALTQKVAVYTCVGALAISVVGLLLNGGVLGMKHAAASHGWFGKKLTLSECQTEYNHAMQQNDQNALQRIQDECKEYVR
jgi:hypothetical protein